MSDGAFVPWACHVVTAAPVGQHATPSCTLVDLVHTNLVAARAADIMQTYLEVADETKADKIGKQLAATYGGFWDVYFMGSSFSYSVTCSEYVELASHEWNVLLCREAEDEEATTCGQTLTRYSNGTLTSAAGATTSGAFNLGMYANYMTDDVPAAEAARVPVVRSMLSSMLSEASLRSPRAADALRQRLDAAFPETMWNVLIELRAAGHYYYSEEQFNFELQGESATRDGALSVAVFDRRCVTLEGEAAGDDDRTDEAERILEAAAAAE